MTVLQEGRARRRPRRRPHLALRRAGRVLAVLVLSAAALLALMVARVQGPATIALNRPVVPVHAKLAAPEPQRGSYGIAPAPIGGQVAVKLKLPLKSGLLFDVHTGQVLWQKDPSRIVPIASLTKMMTALLVAERARPSDRVLITRDALHYTGSGVGLLPKGKRVSLTALLYGLLLPSGNDAAIALADHVAGTQGRFIAQMNQKAQALGLRCTHFASVSGIVDQDNYSCAQDLALIAHLVVTQPLLAPIVASRSAILPFPIKGGKLYLYNNNPLLILRYPGVDGVKTGFTDAAGQCLVATAKRGRTWLGVVLLHSGDTSTQAQTLLSAGFARLG
ncbi:MAG: D-alanyl-D-alanine carboxypeptidase [Solirubrobacterales bacterium]|nr:D-alanyl-D-alanine carboxypeptidase [Solirubrobacterales bacterium]